MKPHNVEFETYTRVGKTATEITQWLCQQCNHKNTNYEIIHYIHDATVLTY